MLLGLMLVPWGRAAGQGSEFSDGFDATTLDPAWAVVLGDPGRQTCSYSLTENPGHLRYRPDWFAQPYRCGLQLIREFTGDYWIFETAVTYFTGPSGGGRQLVLSINFGQPPPPHAFSNNTDNLVFFRQRDDWGGTLPGWLNLSFTEDGQGIPPGFQVPLNPNHTNHNGFVTDSYLLRIRRSGRTVTFEVSDDGITVRFSASHTFGPQITSQPQYLLIHGNSFRNLDSYADYDYMHLTLNPITLAIDIKPGSDPNSINLSSAGRIPAAILSSPDFDAPSQVNPETLRLAGAAVNLIGKSGKLQCSSQDVNDDGLLDLVCHFETAQFFIEAGDSIAVLEGQTFAGIPIRGEDSVRIVPGN